jgi:hypothetical protein
MTYAKIINLDIYLYGKSENSMEKNFDNQHLVLEWLAKNDFIPISETFFYKNL